MTLAEHVAIALKEQGMASVLTIVVEESRKYVSAYNKELLELEPGERSPIWTTQVHVHRAVLSVLESAHGIFENSPAAVREISNAKDTNAS